MSEQKDMSGVLFKNEKKSHDSQPNATGSAMIGGVEYWVSAWTKEGKKGKFQSLAFTKKDEQRGPKKSTDTDIPF